MKFFKWELGINRQIDMSLTTAEIKQIAEYIGLHYMVLEQLEGEIVVNDAPNTFKVFDPEGNDSDNHKVFKALVDECKKRNCRMEFEEGWFYIYHPSFKGFEGEFNNESVCLAYLAVMKGKG